MLVRLSRMPVFCLTLEDENGSRRRHMRREWDKQGVSGIFIAPIVGIAKNKSGASGFFRMIEHGLRLQEPGEPFRPFLMLEDDTSFTDGEKEVVIPDDADLLYVGLSRCSMNESGFHYANYYESTACPGVVRVMHMLATHGIVVCSALGAAAIQRTMLEVFASSDRPWDVPLARLQPFYRVYALREPWVYQDAAYGGDEACTRISLYEDDRPLPREWIRRDGWLTTRLPDGKHT
jgi:hypothetical protein